MGKKNPGEQAARASTTAHGSTPSDPATWLAEHGDVLYRYALLRIRDRDVAEELVQEAFLSGLRGRGEFSGRSSVRTWLVGILRHKIADHFRSREATTPAAEPVEAESFARDFFDDTGHWRTRVPRWGGRVDQAFTDGEFWDVFHDCASSLPDTTAGVFSLRELERMDSDEVCKILGITATNLWARLHRARMYMRRCLELNWFARED